MVDYQRLIASIDQLYTTDCKPEYVIPPPVFPPKFTQAYKGQPESIESLLSSDESLLSSHTGSGKSIVFLAYARSLEVPTIVIEPRKFLQEQIAEYYNDTVVYGRSQYHCFHAINAANAPCLIRDIDEKTQQKIFYVLDESNMEFNPHPYPCPGCPYIIASASAKKTLLKNGVVVCNFGNFWNYMRYSDLIIIDEADLFFKSISMAIKITNGDKLFPTVKETLENEIKYIESDLQHISHINLKNNISEYSQSLKRYENLKNKLERLNFFLEHHDMCFQYSHTTKKTGENEIFVELHPQNIDVLKGKLFANKKLVVVTATPSDFTSKNVVNYSVPQRTRIFYTPIGNMTRTNVFSRNNLHLIAETAEFILTMQSIFRYKYNTDKILVHTGNITGHAYELMKYLPQERCVLHERGKLFETIDRFKQDKERNILLVVGAEYGLSIDYIHLQFIVKVPYQDFNSRIREIQQNMDSDEFNRWYSMDALNRLIQAAGRSGRGADSFGVTLICDSKFKELYYRYRNLFPKWFDEKLDQEVY